MGSKMTQLYTPVGPTNLFFCREGRPNHRMCHSSTLRWFHSMHIEVGSTSPSRFHIPQPTKKCRNPNPLLNNHSVVGRERREMANFWLVWGILSRFKWYPSYQWSPFIASSCSFSLDMSSGQRARQVGKKKDKKGKIAFVHMDSILCKLVVYPNVKKNKVWLGTHSQAPHLPPQQLLLEPSYKYKVVPHLSGNKCSY